MNFDHVLSHAELLAIVQYNPTTGLFGLNSRENARFKASFGRHKVIAVAFERLNVYRHIRRIF